MGNQVAYLMEQDPLELLGHHSVKCRTVLRKERR